MSEIKNPWRLDGRVALVTGASRGIGRIVAETLAERGAEVWLMARGAEAADPRESPRPSHSCAWMAPATSPGR